MLRLERQHSPGGGRDLLGEGRICLSLSDERVQHGWGDGGVGGGQHNVAARAYSEHRTPGRRPGLDLCGRGNVIGDDHARKAHLTAQ